MGGFFRREIFLGWGDFKRERDLSRRSFLGRFFKRGFSEGGLFVSHLPISNIRIIHQPMGTNFPKLSVHLYFVFS